MLLLFGAISLGSATLAAQIIEVAAGAPPGTYVGSPQQAIDGAADGSVILLAPGLHDGFEIDAKSVRVIGDGLAQLRGAVAVRNTSTDQTVVLQNLSSQEEDEFYPLRVSDAAGVVIVDNCLFERAFGDDFFSSGASIERSDAVTLSNSIFVGADGPLCGLSCTDTSTGNGLLVFASQVSVTNSILRGGDGIDGSRSLTGSGGRGGYGLAATNAFVHMAGSTAYGGNGGLGVCDGAGSCQPSGPGASALLSLGLTAQGPPAVLRVREVTATPGVTPGGAPVTPIGSGGNAQLIEFAAAATMLSSNSPVRFGDDLELDLQGAPGQSAWLVASLQLTWLDFPGFAGLLHAGLPWTPNRLVPLGRFPAGSGEISLSIGIPDTGGPVDLLAMVQVVTTGSEGTTLGASAPIVMLEPDL